MFSAKSLIAILLIVGMLVFGGGWIYCQPNGGQTPPKAADKKGDKTEAPKKAGTFEAQIEKVNVDERVVTVYRLGTLVWGLGGADGKITAGEFKNNIRLENLPVSKTAPITIYGKAAQLADLKKNMDVTLDLELNGDITVNGIRTND